MRKVIYSMNPSLDGYIAGPDGKFDWSAPDEELHRFHNEQTRELGAHLSAGGCTRRWSTGSTADEVPRAEHEREFARIWQALPKLVFSTTLDEVEGNARLATGGVAEEVAAAEGADGEASPSAAPGSPRASSSRGLVDEYRLFVNPVVVGGGTPFFPALTSRSTSSWSRRGRSAHASCTSATAAPSHLEAGVPPPERDRAVAGTFRSATPR